jgi:hypothetical protein
MKGNLWSKEQGLSDKGFSGEGQELYNQQKSGICRFFVFVPFVPAIGKLQNPRLTKFLKLRKSFADLS